MDLFKATPLDIRLLMSDETDPAVLRILARLETAAVNEDELERVTAVGELSDLLVLERGA